MSVNKINYKGVDYEIIEDSGWINVELTSSFVQNSNSWATKPVYRKVGNMVEIQGTISPASNISDTTSETTIFTLPEGFRPHQTLWVHQQADNMNVWTMIVRPNGIVSLSRYGITSKGAMSTSGIAFMQVTFLTD